ncbi:unnamed protein product [Sphenostylis stenocarpa]|uniref:Uncharacterized protein n=1 Tax=Sphenostylis stenocarpa TaxID=92480 RepID=A0AA86TFE7_9FABA|nr:unnamed protein product [Sphenostylis stenocarpa]
MKKKKKYDKGMVNTLHAEEGKLEQNKNRKSDDKEDKQEYPAAGLAKKRKHSGDINLISFSILFQIVEGFRKMSEA